MEIYYGTIDKKIDVTIICHDKILVSNYIIIPPDDNIRARLFTDPNVGVLKQIFILTDSVLTEYDHTVKIMINTLDNTITIEKQKSQQDIDEKLQKIQSELKIKGGTFNEELPEQKLAVRYLTGNEKVLEIGSNIGRNSMIIGYILGQKQNNDFVTMECDNDAMPKLYKNRELNGMNFNVENSALSKRKLIQRGWTTIVSDEVLQGYKPVKTITLDELNTKYNIEFDTLVLDCEGAFYYVLMDMPEIIKNIKLIIVENDYTDFSHKQYVDKILRENNFYVDYSESGGWGPCRKFFYEAWKKI